jgi:hypothetical protein
MGRTGQIWALACFGALILLALGASTSLGHESPQSKGVKVTMHVTPSDRPASGQSSRIIITKVKPASGTFTWRSCKCYLRVTDATGDVVLNRLAKRSNRITFPRATAYQIVFTGRVKRNGEFKRFRAKRSIRAS